MNYFQYTQITGIKKPQVELEVFKFFGAGNGTRTRDPDLGKVVLYQLSYSRNMDVHYREFHQTVNTL